MKLCTTIGITVIAATIALLKYADNIPVEPSERRLFTLTCPDGHAYPYRHHVQIDEGSEQWRILCEVFEEGSPRRVFAGQYKVKHDNK